jgi:hypothetical protein
MLLLGAAEIGQMMGSRCTETEVLSRISGPCQVLDGVGVAVLGLRQTAKDRLGVSQSPVVTEGADQPQRLIASRLPPRQFTESDFGPS